MLDDAVDTEEVARLALAGLTAFPKTLPPKLFYDAEGVRLFEAITRLPEYYLTRTERSLLAALAPEIAALASSGSVLVEYGASDEGKALPLLDAVPGRFAAYAPVDVAQEALAAMEGRLRRIRPRLRVEPVCADFMRPLDLPRGVRDLEPFGFFPGSTIGNLDSDEAVDFLSEAARTLGAGACLVVGFDLRKDPELLLPAYDDASGVTGAFNLNLLRRLNREAAADFRPERFRHCAVWNAALGRVEMHLESTVAQRVRVAGTTVEFARGETIHTENSYKHTEKSFASLARTGGWTPRQVWTDNASLFALQALQASPAG